MKRKNVGNVRRNVPSARNVRRNVLLFAIVAALIITLGAVGTFVYKFNTADATIAAGNKAFASLQYDTALEKYTAAQNSAPIFAEPFYNSANVLYKQSKFEDAQKLLEQALTRSNEKIVEFLQFNLGNVAFNAKQFEQAIARYEDALRLNPDDGDAKYNLELALLQKQQQDQQQQQQNQNQQNQNNQNQNQSQQNQNGQGKQDQQQQNGQQNQEQQNQQNGQQQQQGQQQNQQGQQEQKSQNQQNGQPQQQQGQQQDAQQQNGQQDPTAQQPQQGSGAAGQPTDQQDNEKGYAYVPGELTQEQAEQLLAAVGGNSQTLMEKLQQYLYVPGGEPDKDW